MQNYLQHFGGIARVSLPCPTLYNFSHLSAIKSHHDVIMM